MMDNNTKEVYVMRRFQRVERYDLERCYQFYEYKQATNYGKEKRNVSGVDTFLKKLEIAKDNYIQEIQNIVSPEKEIENKKYSLWKKWFAAKQISCYFTVAGFILGIILQCIMETSGILYAFTNMIGKVWVISLGIFCVSFPVEIIIRKQYEGYTDKLRKKIAEKNHAFADMSSQYYQEIDDLYLASLDVPHRETVLLRREQNKHNQEMRRLEEERRRMEADQLEEMRKRRQIEERRLQIEEDRERRYKGW